MQLVDTQRNTPPETTWKEDSSAVYRIRIHHSENLYITKVRLFLNYAK